MTKPFVCLFTLAILALTIIAGAQAAPPATPAPTPTAVPTPTATPEPTPTATPTPQPTPTLHDAVAHLTEVAERVAVKMRAAIVVVEASEDVRCLIANQEGEPESLKLERDFYATPAGRDWRGPWGGILAYNPRREAIEEYVAEHGSEAALDYLKQWEGIIDPLIKVCGG